jgi:uncharacterized protein (DUF2249 family)
MTLHQPVILDVRPILAAGREPLATILEAKQNLQPGQDLHLIAPFAPKPLYALFEADGFSVQQEMQQDGSWKIVFHRGNSTDEITELDLRFLEPPAPLQKSLEALAKLQREQLLVLHTRFKPVHLIEQMDEAAFDYDCEEKESNHWVTHLWRIGPL